VTVQTGSAKRLSRRQLLAGGLTGLGGMAFGAVYASQIEPFWPALERVQMDLPHLAPDFAGLKIVQISDLHISPSMSISYLERQIEFCASLAPDVLVVTGDFVTRGRPEGLKDLNSLAGALHAKLGVFAVLGNHDYNRFFPGPAGDRAAGRIADQIAAALSDNGVQVLRNQVHTITAGAGRLQLVGVDEYWGGNYDPAAAFAGVDAQCPCIALCHNPDAIEDLRRLPCHWVLAGHTHGGQVRLPLLGAPILPVKNRQYDAGLFEVGDKRLYVNRGLGYLHRVRFNCRPEITEFTLQRRA
jgi:uncharacterized protein